MPTAWSIAALDALRATSTSPPAPSSSWLAGFMMPAFTSTWVNFVACMVFQAVWRRAGNWVPYTRGSSTLERSQACGKPVKFYNDCVP
eukprot:g18460.t1